MKTLAPGPSVGLSMAELVEISHQANRDPRMIAAIEKLGGRFEVPANESSMHDYRVACEEYYRTRSEVRREYVNRALEEKRNRVD